MNRLAAFLALVLFGSSAVAYETNEWIGATSANTPATAYNWSNPANWSLNRLPTSDEKVKFPQGSGIYYVRMPDALQLAYIYSTANLRLIGETLTGVRPDSAWSSKFNVHYTRSNCGWMFADLNVVTDGQSGQNPYFNQTFELAGRLTCNYDITPASGTLKLRLDRFAVNANPLRTDDLQIGTRQVIPGDASFSIFAGGAVASESAWRQVEGSPYIELADASAEHTAVGATVTGDGIPPGTFVRRRFDESTLIELSQPATKTLASNVLAFAAFNPDARVKVATHAGMGSGGSRIRLCRRMEEDGLSYEVVTLNANPKGFSWGHGILPSDEAGWLPGKLILHNVGDVKNNTAPIVDRLNECHIEFGGALKNGALTGEPTTFPASRIVGFETAGATARLTVPEGKAGVIEKFVSMTGTILKDGAGSLSINMAEAVTTGAIAVEAGALTLTQDASVTDPMTLARLEIAAGATFTMPSEGLTVETLVVGEGATVEGSGTLTVTGSLTGMPILDGEIRFVPPPMPSLARADLVADLKPIWIIDATDYGSAKMETYVENGTNFLSKWYDSTGSGEYFKSRGGTKSSSGFPLGCADCWVVEDANCGMPYVDMGPYLWKPNGAGQTFVTEGLDRSLLLYGANDIAYRASGESDASDVNKRKALKAAFFVVGTQYGGGTLLGSYGNSFMSISPINHGQGPDGPMFAYDGWRTSDYLPLFNAAKIDSGATYFKVNGETVYPKETVWQNGFSQISYASDTAIKASALLGCVGTSGNYERNSGGLMWGEAIALEEKPTVAQAQAIEAYLNVKWFGVRNPGFFAEYGLLELHGAETSLIGSDGTVYAGALAGFGKLTANLQLTGDTFDVLTDATGKIGTFTVTGTAQLPAAGTVRVGGERKPAAGSYVILASGGLSCDLSDWTVVRYPGDTREYALSKDEDSVVLTVSPSGLLFLVR